MKRFIWIYIFGLILLSSGFWAQNSSAQTTDYQPGEAIFGEPNVNPSQLHRMLAQMKQDRLNQLRQAGISLPLKETLAQSQYNARYYRLDLNLNDTTEIVSGSVYIYAQALVDGFNLLELNFFDNPQMYLDSIKSNDLLLSFTWTDDIIQISLNQTYDQEPFDLTVYYHGHPLEEGLQCFDWGIHGSPSVPVISTLSCPYFSQAWWPCKDLPRDKADSVDVNVTVRSDLYVASNGLLREIEDHGSTKTFKWHEKYPIATYLIFFSATNYYIFSNWYHTLSGDSLEVKYYVYPEMLYYSQLWYPITTTMMECYAGLFGEYPFVEEKYGIAHFNWPGGMEHQTCISLDRSLSSEWIITHELSHQWWGDYITCHNWHHVWLNEGFAVYCEALWAEYRYGETYYHDYMNDFQFFHGGSIFIEDTTDAWEIFTPIVYDKGGWVHHMLRHVVGDSIYFAIMRAYYSDPRYAYGVAETEDFQEVCETVSSMDLDYFFEEWIYGTYYPQYEYSYIYEPVRDDYYDVFIHIEQIQTTDPVHFTMPIDIAIGTELMDTTVRVFNDPRHKDFTVRVTGAGINVDLDPDRWILRQVNTTTYGMNLITTDLPCAYQTVSYAETLSAKGGVVPYTWELESGNLPDGLVLDPSTGVISGVPTVLDSFEFTVRVTDSNSPNQTDNQELFIVVKELIRGDVNNDLVVDVGDVIYLINYLYRDGSEPIPPQSGDVNCDEIIDVGDVVYLINYLYRGGLPPC